MTPEEALRNTLSLVDGSDEVEDVHALQILLQSIKTLAEATKSTAKRWLSKRRGQDGQKETEQPDHSASLGDSITSSTQIRFSVHTGVVIGLLGHFGAAAMN